MRKRSIAWIRLYEVEYCFSYNYYTIWILIYIIHTFAINPPWVFLIKQDLLIGFLKDFSPLDHS